MRTDRRSEAAGVRRFVHRTRATGAIANPQAGGAPVELPSDPGSPLGRIGNRVILALALITLVAVITYVGRDGYIDPEDSEISILDAFYYSTVSVTTTGYGDIRPISDGARLATTLLVTPARVLFLIVLVGTTLEILAERTRFAYRLSKWRKGLTGHTIVCGYGTKGRTAISTLLGQGIPAARIVVIDKSHDARQAANAAGFTAVAGDASAQEVLEEARVGAAESVVVAVERDDSAVLIALTARELAPDATIVASVREEENVHLLHQSGADSVVTSSGTAGRMLGMATHAPGVAAVLEDLLAVGAGLDIVQSEVTPEQAGAIDRHAADGPVVAVLRDGEVLNFDDERVAEVQAGDKLITVRSRS
ncbi:MAG TPA: potassium channel family protein [Solirubrobacterales bacterium]|nr:potassium channel family protein [Solirubrobacterales bacterium]